MIRYVAGYLGAAVVFAGLDAVWLTMTNASLYRPLLAPVLIPGLRLAPAILFYLIYLAGLMVFAIRPAIARASWTTAMVLGGLFGFFAYATYDLTNQATLLVWSTQITLMDLAWGTILSSTGASAGYFASVLVRRKAA